MTQARLLVDVLRRICASRGYGLEEMSDGWLLSVKCGGRVHFVVGYDVGLNSSAASQLVNDKSTAFQALQAVGVPAIEHVLFHSPRMTPYVNPEGNWRDLLELFEKWNRDVVCKPHMGTGGDQVSRARTPRELEEVAQILFQSNRALTVSPYYEFAEEYRVIILDGESRLGFRKERHSVVGDGESTVGTLASSSDSVLPGNTLFATDLAYIPSVGERVVLEWRHNLGHGARPITIDRNTNKEVIALCKRAMRELGLRFASVDIAAGAELKVLEINSGVMLDRYATFSDANWQVSAKIYEDALDRAFQRTTQELFN